MTYEEAMSNNIILAYEAKREIEKHGLDFEDFVTEYGDLNEYYSKDVMIWLGY
jgi:hypothetical protein